MSRHEGVSCDNCLTSNFRQKRFKCLICYDYDLCELCFDNNVSTSRHSPSHPMQCILTKHDFDLFYGGEGIAMENPPSLTCPLCGKRGMTEVGLQEHVNSQHLDTGMEVVCPICAAVPAGDPNHVTDDFATHLAIEHNNSHRAGMEDPIGRQGMRRMFYPGRSVRGARAQRSANMHFSGGPSSVPAFSNNVANTAVSSVPQIRDAMDPIAELLSQLSGVRRNAQQLQQTVSTASQLQELQAQLQLERQRASMIRQQLERIPSKIQMTQNGKQSGNQSGGAQSKSYATAVKTSKEELSSSASEDEDPRLLLSNIYEKDSEAGTESQNIDIFEQSLFVRELIMALPIEDGRSPSTDLALEPSPSTATARAIPVDCGVVSTPNKQESNESDADASATLTNVGGACSATHLTTETAGHSIQPHFEAGKSASSTENDRAARADSEVSSGIRKSNSAEKSPMRHQSLENKSDLKKDSSNRQSQYSSESANVAGLVRSQSSHPVSSFPVLVSGATEQ